MATLWSELGYNSTFRVIKCAEEQSGNGHQAALALIEKFIGYIRQHGGQVGTGTLPANKMKEYRFSTADGQANNILDILQYGLTMCQQSTEKVAVYLGKTSTHTALSMTILQGTKKEIQEPYICFQVQYNNANQAVKCSYFYNSQEWNRTEKGGN